MCRSAVLLQREGSLVVVGEDFPDMFDHRWENECSVYLRVDSEFCIDEDWWGEAKHGESSVNVLVRWMFVSGDRWYVLAGQNVHPFVMSVGLVLVEDMCGVGKDDCFPVNSWRIAPNVTEIFALADVGCSESAVTGSDAPLVPRCSEKSRHHLG